MPLLIAPASVINVRMDWLWRWKMCCLTNTCILLKTIGGRLPIFDIGLFVRWWISDGNLPQASISKYTKACILVWYCSSTNTCLPEPTQCAHSSCSSIGCFQWNRPRLLNHAIGDPNGWVEHWWWDNLKYSSWQKRQDVIVPPFKKVLWWLSSYCSGRVEGYQ